MNQSPSVRAFFAINFSLIDKKKIYNYIILQISTQLIHQINWVRLENLHITLQFIPHLIMIDIDKIILRVQHRLENYKNFNVILNTLELFPQNNPKVVASSNIHPVSKLNGLSIIIGEVIENMGYEIEKRNFHPHLTLGRLQSKHCELPNIKVLKLDVWTNQIVLFQSKHSCNGANYFPLKKITF
jgi:2'-5' RNA ligase